MSEARLLERCARALALTLAGLFLTSFACADSTETLLHRFDGTPADGTNPVGFTAAADGNFYGTTVGQLGLNSGTVFKMTPTGTLTTLYTFDGTDGIGPVSILQARGGNFYGVTHNGPNGTGTLFRITPAGTFTTLHTFAPFDFNGINADGAYAIGGLIEGSDGNLYGTTSGGGVHSHGTVFRMTPTGVFSVLHAFDGESTVGTSPAGTPWGRLVEAPDGSLYGTTQLGGDFSQGSVFRIAKDGSNYAVIFSFRDPGITGNIDGAQPLSGLIVGSDGNLYGTSSVGGQYLGTGSAFEFGTVFRITPAGSMTVLYTFVNAEDGALPAAELSTRGDGVLYGTTNAAGSSNAGTVFRIKEDGTEFVSLYSFGTTPYPLPFGDANCPFASVVPAAGGALYGISRYGGYAMDQGCSGMGIAYKVTPAATLPVTSIAVAPATITVGESATLQWTSSNAVGCFGRYAWDGAKALNGQELVTPQSPGVYPFYLRCGGGGGTAVASTMLTVREAPPTLNLAFDPAVVDKGQTSTLTWSTTGATACTSSGEWTGGRDPSGSIGVVQAPVATTQYSYTLTCTGGGGSITRTAVLTVRVGNGGSSGGGSTSSGGSGGGGGGIGWGLALLLTLIHAVRARAYVRI